MKYPDDFEQIWSVYPRRINKSLAYKKYNTALKHGATHGEIINGVIEYAHWVNRTGTESQFVCHLATFLGQQRWENEYSSMDTEPSTSGVHAKLRSRGRDAIEAAFDNILQQMER